MNKVFISLRNRLALFWEEGGVGELLRPDWTQTPLARFLGSKAGPSPNALHSVLRSGEHEIRLWVVETLWQRDHSSIGLCFQAIKAQGMDWDLGRTLFAGEMERLRAWPLEKASLPRNAGQGAPLFEERAVGSPLFATPSLVHAACQSHSTSD